MEHDPHVAVPKVPQRRCIARDALGNPVCALTGDALWPKAHTALTDPERQSVGAAQIVVMTRPARDIAVAAQDLVIK
jgi:hypothetical protein